ncbi:hypothetical protein AURDEDRAFT_145485 [Auricularia subglabra TFB-10046 SS5]|nr:hypothetical protein AURDEDRAFT_145485 [Auricularia subglabra TFB-10046 SS5]
MTSRHALLLLIASSTVLADSRSGQAPINSDPTDTSNPILVGKRFPFDKIPYQADTSSSDRGAQSGYNRCNSTTAGQESMCQTAILNSLDDFCLWGPPKPDTAIEDSESFEVAWCTKPTHGARTIPAGALTGVQFIKTPSYVQITGHIKQNLINIKEGNTGGELDSGGQDGRGNPIGSLVYSSHFGSEQIPGQVVSWHNFIGSNTFCFKACDPNGANPVGLCQHIYDRIGCAYNAPADYTDGVFLSCAGEDQDPVGIYTGEDGVVTTYKQPPEGDGAITSIPYVARIPKTSECKTFTSSLLYANAPKPPGDSGSKPPGDSSNTSKPNSPSNTQSGNPPGSTDGTGAAVSKSASVAGIFAAALFGLMFAA